MNVVAAALRGALPMWAKEPIRNLLNAAAFSRQPQLPFDPSRLRAASTVDLSSIFGDAQVAVAFDQDQATISKYYEMGELFAGVNPGDRRALYYLIAHLRPTRVLEVGTHIGTSTVYIAAALRRFSGPGALVTTVDILDVNAVDAPWAKVGLPANPAELADRIGVSGYIKFVTRAAAEALRDSPGQFDLIFLDGDHSELAVYCEISAALPLLADNGSILLHDFYPEGRPLTPEGDVEMGPYLSSDRIRRECKGIFFLPLGQLPWETRAGGHGTSLALVTSI